MEPPGGPGADPRRWCCAAALAQVKAHGVRRNLWSQRRTVSGVKRGRSLRATLQTQLPASGAGQPKRGGDEGAKKGGSVLAACACMQQGRPLRYSLDNDTTACWSGVETDGCNSQHTITLCHATEEPKQRSHTQEPLRLLQRRTKERPLAVHSTRTREHRRTKRTSQGGRHYSAEFTETGWDGAARRRRQGGAVRCAQVAAAAAVERRHPLCGRQQRQRQQRPLRAAVA